MVLDIFRILHLLERESHRILAENKIFIDLRGGVQRQPFTPAHSSGRPFPTLRQAYHIKHNLLNTQKGKTK